MVYRTAILLLFLSLPVALAFDFGSQLYNITLASASPLLNYSPSNITNGQNGWNITYTGSPWSLLGTPVTDPTLTGSPIGNGSSIQWTNTSSASVSFSFYGTGFAVLGKLYNGRTELNIDGMTISTTASITEGGPESTATTTQAVATSSPVSSPLPPSGGYDDRPVLGQANGLDLKWHQVSVTYYAANSSGTSGVEVYGARLVMYNGQSGATTRNTTAPAVSKTGGSLSLQFDWIWSGNWILYDYPGNISSFQAYTSSPGSITAVSVPSNTSIVLIIGSIVPPGASYGILADIEAPDSVIQSIGNPAYYADSASGDAQYNHMLNYTTRTDFIAQNQVLYAMQWMTGYAGTVYVDVLDGTMGGMGIDSAVFLAADGNPSSINATTSNTYKSQSPPGIIAGSVVGGVALLAIVITLIWYFCVKRRRLQHGEEDVNEKHELDSDKVEMDSPPIHLVPIQHDGPTHESPYVALAPAITGTIPSTSAPAAQSETAQSAESSAHPSMTQSEKATFIAARNTSGSPEYHPAHSQLSRLQIGSSPSPSHAPSPISAQPSLRASASPVSPHPSGTLVNSLSSHDTRPSPLDPRMEDAAFRHKWEVLNEIDRRDNAASSLSGTAAGTRPASRQETNGAQMDRDNDTAGPYRVETDAGRVQEEVLPPNYNPAWRDQ